MSISGQKRAPQEQHRSFRQLELLLDLAAAISQAKESGEIYRAAAQGLVHSLSADRAAVMIFEMDGVLRFKESVGLSDEYRAAVEGHTPWRRGAVEAQPIAVSDVLQDASLSAYRQAFAKEGIRAIAFIPLMAKGGLIGKFVLYYNVPHEFQSEEIRVSEAIATHVSRAWERQHVEQTLRESEQRLLFAESAAHVGVWDCDLRTNVTLISREYARVHGLALDHVSLTYEEWLGLVHPDDRERLKAGLQESIEKTHLWDREFRVVWPDGSVHWLHGKGKVFLDDSGLPVRMTGASFDITERKQAEAALRESEERFRTMADTAPVMIWGSGPDKLCTFFNKVWLEFTGRTIEQELGDGWAESVHPEDLDRCLDVYSSSFEARCNFHMEYRLRRKDGEYRWVLDNGVPRFEPDGVFAGYIGSCIDITEMKRAQKIENRLTSDLEHSRDEIRALAASLMKAQEDERRRISRELHDQICHQLASLAVEIGELAVSPLPPEKSRVYFEAIRARVLETSQDAHHIAYQMHAAILEDLGLTASLKDLCRQFSERDPKIAVSFKYSGPRASIPSEVASCLYRVAQESLQNMAKHSGAKNVSVRLGLEKGAVVLKIKDDGVGFDRKAVKGRGGLGLIGMEERARLVNGKLTITTQVSHGTRITLGVPLPADNS